MGRTRVKEGPQGDLLGGRARADGQSGPGGVNKSSSFRRIRSRAARACEVCHARKVRCDVVLHQPCTNCIAFEVECRVPELKGRKMRATSHEGSGSPQGSSPASDGTEQPAIKLAPPPKASAAVSGNGVHGRQLAPQAMPTIENGQLRPAPPTEHAKDGVFLGSASHFSFLTENCDEDSESAHYTFPLMGSRRIAELSQEDVAVLKMKGAFLLPTKELASALIDAYFDYVHPILPVINKTEFMEHFKDPMRPPSLLLQHAIFCAAAHCCRHPALAEENGSHASSAKLFYSRAKALFDAEYEEDRTTALAAAMILSLSVDSPERTNNNAFFWTRVAVTLSQSLGMHRWMSRSKLPTIEKRMWKRVWWSLFVRDRSTAAAYGRPMMINLEDTDVPMLEASDFDESTPGGPPAIPPNPEHVDIFIYMVKLHEIMGLVLRQQYSLGAERLRLRNQLPDVSQCDMALASWVNNMPFSIRYSIKDVNTQSYFKALLFLQYYTVLCLAHRPQVVHFSHSPGGAYPSWGIAFQAAHMIVKILENLRRLNQITCLPPFFIYTCFSALIMLVYQTQSPQEHVRNAADEALESLMLDIKVLGGVYETASQIVNYLPYLGSEGVKTRVLRMPRKRSTNSEYVGVRGTGSNHRLLGADSSVPRKSRMDIVDSKHEMQSERRPLTGRVVKDVKPEPPTNGGLQEENSQFGPLSPGLFMVTEPAPIQQDQMEKFEPQLLFPQAHEAAQHGGQTPAEFLVPLFAGDKDIKDVLANDGGNTAMSSGDESLGAPDTLNMGDWYDFLMSNAELPE